jgi:WD40 repeat protein
VKPIPEVPSDAIQWEPSNSWRHAVLRTKPGVISLWDANTKSAQELDATAPLLDVAFSPDESEVAVVTSDDNGYSHPRLRIFETGTGKLVHELRVGEIVCDRLRLPQWTPDSRYVLAVTKPDSFFSNENVSLWNAKTGRHRADFFGCIGISGFILLPPGDQLIANCNDGTLHIWDFKAATQKISELEESFAPTTIP